MEEQSKQSKMWVFAAVWFGQVVSLVGSGLTEFALAVWVFQQSGSTTRFGLLTVCAFLPSTLIAPFAGTLVDRWDRRWVMILSDAGAASGTVVLLLLLAGDRFELWHVYPIVIFGSLCSAFQEPAYLTTVPLLIPQRHLGRANGMLQAGEAFSEILAPLLGAALLVTIQLWGVILLDLGTFAFALLTLLFVRFPRPAQTQVSNLQPGSLLKDTLAGWTYIKSRSGLFGLLLFLAATNFTLGFVFVLFTPLVLGIANETTLGFVATMSGVGMLCGGIVMSVWGGPKQRVKGMLGFRILQGILLFMVGLRPHIPLITGAAFLFMLVDPFIEGNAKVLLQRKVAPGFQGRVFSLQNLITYPSFIFAALLAGPLVDYVFEPLFAVDGSLAGSLGQIIGVGPGRGTGFLFIIMGILTLLVTGIGFFYPRLRLLEQELPDMISDEEQENE